MMSIIICPNCHYKITNITLPNECPMCGYPLVDDGVGFIHG